MTSPISSPCEPRSSLIRSVPSRPDLVGVTMLHLRCKPQRTRTPPDSFYRRSLVWSAVAITTLCIIVGVGFAIWTVTNRKSRVVKVAQPGFLCAIVVGSLLSLSSIFPAAIDSRSYGTPQDESSRFSSLDRGCNQQAWTYSVGFMITFASLLTKLWRVTRIVNTTTVGQKFLSSRALTLLAASLVGVQVTAM